jgi:hypothetical protein
MNDIWTKIKGEVLFRDGLASCGFDRDLVATFADELSHEHRYSLDAFLETHQEFLDVGKAAIALSMVPCEMDTTITPKQKNGWHRYFFNQMLHGGPSRVRSQEAFALNRLSVVTFNFERSFERALFLFLKHTFKSEDDVDALDLVQQIPVFHVHGDLGKPDWVGSMIESFVGRTNRKCQFKWSRNAPNGFDLLLMNSLQTTPISRRRGIAFRTRRKSCSWASRTTIGTWTGSASSGRNGASCRFGALVMI